MSTTATYPHHIINFNCSMYELKSGDELLNYMLRHTVISTLVRKKRQYQCYDVIEGMVPLYKNFIEKYMQSITERLTLDYIHKENSCIKHTNSHQPHHPKYTVYGGDRVYK